MTNVVQVWLTTSLFCLGVFLIPVGLALVLVPGKFLALGNILNRWISTTAFFNKLDAPRNYERYFYKNHRLLGGLITLFSGFSIYMLVFYAGMNVTAAALERAAGSIFDKWLLITCYYLLIGLSVLALIAGIVIYFRPSLLKSLEAWGNRWIDTQTPLLRFDKVHEIPITILPGKPRLFGCIVLVGALYITYVTGIIIF
jgi:hypothetical protein